MFKRADYTSRVRNLSPAERRLVKKATGFTRDKADLDNAFGKYLPVAPETTALFRDIQVPLDPNAPAAPGGPSKRALDEALSDPAATALQGRLNNVFQETPLEKNRRVACTASIEELNRMFSLIPQTYTARSFVNKVRELQTATHEAVEAKHKRQQANLKAELDSEVFVTAPPGPGPLPGSLQATLHIPDQATFDKTKKEMLQKLTDKQTKELKELEDNSKKFIDELHTEATNNEASIARRVVLFRHLKEGSKASKELEARKTKLRSEKAATKAGKATMGALVARAGGPDHEETLIDLEIDISNPGDLQTITGATFKKDKDTNAYILQPGWTNIFYRRFTYQEKEKADYMFIALWIKEESKGKMKKLPVTLTDYEDMDVAYAKARLIIEAIVESGAYPLEDIELTINGKKFDLDKAGELYAGYEKSFEGLQKKSKDIVKADKDIEDRKEQANKSTDHKNELNTQKVIAEEAKFGSLSERLMHFAQAVDACYQSTPPAAGGGFDLPPDFSTTLIAVAQEIDPSFKKVPGESMHDTLCRAVDLHAPNTTEDRLVSILRKCDDKTGLGKYAAANNRADFEHTYANIPAATPVPAF